MEGLDLFLLIAVVVITVRFGLWVGGVSTALAVGYMLIDTLGTPNLFGEDISFYRSLFRLSAGPTGVVFAFLFSWYEASRLRQRIRRQETQLSVIADESERIIRQNDELVKIREVLERKLVRDDAFSLKLQEAVDKLATLNEAEVKNSMMEIITQFIQARSVSYYRYEGGALVREHTLFALETLDERFEAGHPLYDRLSTAGTTVLTVKDGLGDLGMPIILAGNVTDPQGALIGAIFVQEIDFVDLNIANVNLFKMLCRWAGKNMANASEYREKKASAITVSGSQLFNRAFFERMAEREFLMARRYKTVCSFAMLAIQHSDAISDTSMQNLLNIVSDVFQERFRKMDAVFFDESNGGRIILMMPMTESGNAMIPVDGFLHALGEKELHPYMNSSEKLSFSVDIITFDEHSDADAYARLTAADGDTLEAAS